jgi:hypothetical protein
MTKLRNSATLAALLSLAGLPGCHSAFVTVSITNRSSAPVSLIEVDYPSASFGTGSLAPGAQYQYRFKILGEGPVKIQFTDAKGVLHTASGPVLKEKEEGSLKIELDENAKVSWNLHLNASK